MIRSRRIRESVGSVSWRRKSGWVIQWHESRRRNRYIRKARIPYWRRMLNRVIMILCMSIVRARGLIMGIYGISEVRIRCGRGISIVNGLELMV